ncbi:MAG: hypothetical protein CMM01_05495 [Rhodopirellula sp.]|nr:hypothetical protein [Rhodopirellula sp.]
MHDPAHALVRATPSAALNEWEARSDDGIRYTELLERFAEENDVGKCAGRYSSVLGRQCHACLGLNTGSKPVFLKTQCCWVHAKNCGSMHLCNREQRGCLLRGSSRMGRDGIALDACEPIDGFGAGEEGRVGWQDGRARRRVRGYNRNSGNASPFSGKF